MDNETPEVEQLIHMIVTSGGDAYRQAKEKLVAMGELAVEPLFAAIKQDDRNEGLVDFEHTPLRAVFVQLGEPAFQAILTALSTPKLCSRSAVKTSVLFEDLRAIPPLINVIKEDGYDLNSRLYAIDALAYFKDARAFEPLLAALKHGDAYMRGTAARALREYQDKRALEPLRECLKIVTKSAPFDWRATVEAAIVSITNGTSPTDRGFFINNRYYFKRE